MVVAALAGTAALLSFVTQRYVAAPSTVVDGVPETLLRVQQVMPFLSAAGLLIAGGVVPVALLVYWVANQSWTLAQTAVIARWFATPDPAPRGR